MISKLEVIFMCDRKTLRVCRVCDTLPSAYDQFSLHSFFPQFLIFQKNDSAETLRKLTLTSGHYYFVEKLKIVEKKLCKLNKLIL